MLGWMYIELSFGGVMKPLQPPTTGTLLQYLLQLQHNRVANFTVATIGSIAIPYHDGLCKAPTGEKRLYLTVTCHHQSLSPLLDIFMFFGGSIN